MLNDRITQPTSPSTQGLRNALTNAQVARRIAAEDHRSQPGANLLDSYRITKALRSAR